MFLFRLLRPHETPSSGLRPTDPSAQIQIKDHVEREGALNRIDSQFISTMRDPAVTLGWVFQEHRYSRDPRIAVINCSLLQPRTLLFDLSMGHNSLQPRYDDYVRKHKEVLVYPFINPDAIVAVYYYQDLMDLYGSPPIKDSSISFAGYYTLAISRQHSIPECSRCSLYGHDIQRNHYCSWYAYYDAQKSEVVIMVNGDQWLIIS